MRAERLCLDAIERPICDIGLVVLVQPGQRPRPARVRAQAAAKQIGRDPEQPRARIVTGAIEAAPRVEGNPKRLGGDILACRAGPADAVAMDPQPVTIEDLGKPGRITPGGSDDRPVAEVSVRRRHLFTIARSRATGSQRAASSPTARCSAPRSDWSSV